MTKAAMLLFSFVIVSCEVASATAQQGDILLLNGKKYSIYTNPLAPFLNANPGRLPKSDVTSSGLWRGYVATWEVKNDRLALVDVAILKSHSNSDKQGFSTELVSVMAEVFPGEKMVVANWFSGHIIVPDGKLVKYVHMGYASTYKKYILLRVEKGVVTRKWVTNTASFLKFRDAQFDAFKKTDEYRKALADTAKEGGMDAKGNEEFLREFYSERYMSLIFDNPQ